MLKQFDLIPLRDVAEKTKVQTQAELHCLRLQLAEIGRVTVVGGAARADQRDVRPASRDLRHGAKGREVILVHPELVADDEVGAVDRVG